MNRPDPLNILLVDDQPGKLLTYEAILAELGENLIKATSGREALEFLLKTDVTVVLMDVSMPELDGFELAEIIRQHPRHQKTAIIFVSAVHLSDLDRLRGYESGAVDYLSVPVVPELLRAKVAVFTELYRKTRDAERLNQQLEERVALRTRELESSTRQQMELAEKLREADRRKDEFLALLAHELRNPLAPIANAVGVLRRTSPPDERIQWCVNVIERQSRQLSRLVDDLLDVSRIALGKIALKRIPVDLSVVVDAAVETSRPFIDLRRHDFRVSLPESPVMIHGDMARLTQMLANLLNNAAKFQPDGGRIDLWVRCDGAEVVIGVRDQGMGIPDEMRGQVFTLFAQGKQTLDRKDGGLGVGLSLVKTIAELHGGSATVISDGAERGSEFTVRLPLLPPDGRNTATEPGPAALAEARPPPPRRILVVDDSLDAAESLGSLLSLDGHSVSLAHDGPTAVAKARTERPEVILLDIGLPGMDGYEVCRQVRAQGLTDVLIIALTGYGQERDRDLSKRAGFDTHAVKPVELAVLAGLLATARAREGAS